NIRLFVFAERCRSADSSVAGMVAIIPDYGNRDLLSRGRFPDANDGGRKKQVVGHLSQNDVVQHEHRSMNQQPRAAAQYDTGRGKGAPTPRQIPKGGWWSICKRVYASLNSKHLSILAGGVAFFAMLSIFPALAALVAIYGLIADPATVSVTPAVGHAHQF